jgi:hypothetical protein
MRSLKLKSLLAFALLLAGIASAQNQGATYVSPAVPQTLNPAFLGPGPNNTCYVDGVIHPNIQSCADYLGITLGLNGGKIYTNLPEDITVDPFPGSFAAELYVGSGLNSTSCDTTHINCLVTEVPIPLVSGTTFYGTGRTGTNYSSGSTITYGTNFPPPLGVPTEGSITCGSTGGSLSNGTYFVGVRTVNNLETHSGKAKIAGPSMTTALASVSCAGGTSTQSITVPIPSAVGNSPFQAQDFEVCESSTSTGDCYAQIPGSGMTCTTGVVDTVNGCKMSSGTSAVIGTIQTSTFPFELIDLSNPMFVAGPNQNIQFAIQFRDFTLDCRTGSTNAPNVLFWNYSGQELAGFANGSTELQGACGGYSAGASGTTGGSATPFPGAYFYMSSMGPNSAIDHLQTSSGPSAGTFYTGIFDGRVNTTGSANGSTRLVHDVTATPKGGATVPAIFLVTGTRARIHFDDVHLEGGTGNTDGIQCTNGAYCLVTGVEGFTGNGASGNLVHLTSTGVGASGAGLCPMGSGGGGRCQNGIAFLDDVNTQSYTGYQNFFAGGSTAAPSNIANLIVPTALAANGPISSAGQGLAGSNYARLTANFTTSSTSFVPITGWTWSVAINTKVSIHCKGSYSQATAAAANQFGIKVNSAPTNISAAMDVKTSLADVGVNATLPTLTTTTATEIGAFTPSAFGAIGTVADIFTFDLWFTVENGASGISAITPVVLSGSASDAFTIYKDVSFCELIP